MNIINLSFPSSFSWCSASHMPYALTNPAQVYGSRRQFKCNSHNLFREIYKSISFLWIMQLNWRYFFDGTWDMMDRKSAFEELSNTLEISLKFLNYGLNLINFLSFNFRLPHPNCSSVWECFYMTAAENYGISRLAMLLCGCVQSTGVYFYRDGR